MDDETKEPLDFYRSLIPWKSLDVECALNFWNRTTGETLQNFDYVIEDFQSQMGVEMKDLDIVAIAYEYVLGEARNNIDNVYEYDFINDYDGPGTEIHVYGDYMATGYDYSSDAIEKLENIIKKDKSKIKELEIVTINFLEELGLEIVKELD